MTRKSTATVAMLGATDVTIVPAFTAADCAAMIADAFKVAIPQIVTAVSNVAAPVALPDPVVADVVAVEPTAPVESGAASARIGKIFLGYAATMADPAALPHSKAWARSQEAWLYDTLDKVGGDAELALQAFDLDRAERRAKRAAKRDAAANNVTNAARPVARPVTVASNTPSAAGKTAIRRTAAELAALGIIVTG